MSTDIRQATRENAINLNTCNLAALTPAQLRSVKQQLDKMLLDVELVNQEDEKFVAQLANEALKHRAVHHPYLQALATGSLPDMRWALADFARQYYGYSVHFPRYLTSVISRLEKPGHREALLENLTEESGIYAEEELNELAEMGVERAWIVGLPHPQLFKRFANALGVDFTAEAPAAIQVSCWNSMFLKLLSVGSTAESIGALGLGTENIVSTMYGYFVAALAQLDDLTDYDTVFFKLHTAVDDHHQASLQAIAVDLARTENGKVALRQGMIQALMMRSAFWDWLYERALQPKSTEEVG